MVLYSLMVFSHCSFTWEGWEDSKREPLKDDRVSCGPIFEESREELRPLFSIAVNYFTFNPHVQHSTHELFGADWNKAGETLLSAACIFPMPHLPFWDLGHSGPFADGECSRAGAVIRDRAICQ